VSRNGLSGRSSNRNERHREIVVVGHRRFPRTSPMGRLSITLRILKNGATKSFEQSYNCQAAVDGHWQMIVASRVSQEANDKGELKPVVEKLKSNLDGATPQRMTTDKGYFSEENVTYLAQEKIDGYVATGRIKHEDKRCLCLGDELQRMRA
jgi:hypothetical protein